MTTIVRRGVIAEGAGDDGNTLDVTMLPWGTVARVSDGGRPFEEEWQRGSLVAAAGAVIPVYDGHMPTARGIEHGPLIGRVRDVSVDGDRFAGSVELARTVRGREVYELARLVGADVSIEADTGEVDTPPNRAGRVVRTARNPATLTGLAIVLAPNRGAIPGATVTAARALPTEGNTAMSDTPAPDPTTPDPTPAPTPDTPPEPTLARADVAELVRSELARVRLPQLPERGHPLAAYRTLVQFADDAYAGGSARVPGTIARALADQISGDNPGVNAPAWLTEVYGIVDMGRPVIAAIGTTGLPDGGMNIDWPYFAGDLLTLVAEQATQKTQITSVKVSLQTGQAPIKSYAGGSDLSYQLIRRSSPSYRDAYLRIMNAAYAAVTDKAASDAIIPLVTLANGNYVIYDPAAADADGSKLRGAVFAASTKVQLATGTPASVVLAGTTAFIALGGKLTPAPVFNATGSGQASTLEASVSGLRLVHAPHFPATAIIVTNGQAVAWREDGPFVIAAPDVALLGEDVAVWGMAALTATTPKGVVGLVATAPTTAEAGEQSSGKAA